MPTNYAGMSCLELREIINRENAPTHAWDEWSLRTRLVWRDIACELAGMRGINTFPIIRCPYILTIEPLYDVAREVLRGLIADRHPCLATYTSLSDYQANPDLFAVDDSCPYVMSADGTLPREDAVAADGAHYNKSRSYRMYPCGACPRLTTYEQSVILSDSSKERGFLCNVCRTAVEVVWGWYVGPEGEPASGEMLMSCAVSVDGSWVLKSEKDHFKRCDSCGYFGIKNKCGNCKTKVPVPGKLHGYHATDPTLIGWFPEKKDGVRYFGLEIEVFAQHRSDFLTESEKSPWFTVQRDGSLDDVCGAEIISAPHSFDSLRERFLGDNGEAWRKLMKAGTCTGHNRAECGMHIHVSRDSLTDDTINRLRSFMLKGINGAFLDIVAQRVSNQYCVRSISRDRRYEAMNTVPAHTIEFRLFRSNTRCDRIMKNIEFVESLIRFAETHPPFMTWKRYLRWLSQHVETFPYLSAFLMEHHVQVDAEFLSVSRRMSLSAESDDSLLTEDFYVENLERSVGSVYQPAGIQAGDSPRHVPAHYPA